ncbi:MAG: type II toxin-antitoxin system prevent-host-death family antitoxin [Deltaproteobacteria bacterium]|nr:type II toxin-antitoxin system prevent-host-death family antitoxin [Deltaproteobacteria bacterium]
MKTASATISHLKAHLSEHLARVRAGGTVVVHDRRTPIARIVPMAREAGDDLEIDEPTAPLPALARRGTIELARVVDVVQALRADRDAR